MRVWCVTLAAALHPNSRPIVTGTDHHYALEHRHVTADTAVKAAGSTCQKSTPLCRRYYYLGADKITNYIFCL
jgi:hypothetical protein